MKRKDLNYKLIYWKHLLFTMSAASFKFWMRKSILIPLKYKKETKQSGLSPSEIVTKEHCMGILHLHLYKCEWKWRRIINNKIN